VGNTCAIEREAHDLRHECGFAVPRPELAAVVGAECFVREIRTPDPRAVPA
jgi:hypothetical protein